MKQLTFCYILEPVHDDTTATSQTFYSVAIFKNLEQLFCNRLESCLDKCNILSECQCGFRAERSTSLALIHTMEEIRTGLDNDKFAVGILIDLKKAFDTINHHILIHKLELYGVTGVASRWVESYLTNRKQFVKLNEHCSSCLCIPCGVPQGSVSGPRFFNLNINDRCNVSKILKLVLFADDTSIVLSHVGLLKLLEIINNEMEINR